MVEMGGLRVGGRKLGEKTLSFCMFFFFKVI